MGRYWNTCTGRGGKFGFGCQSSEDPEQFFGMTSTCITYISDDGNKIKQKIDKIYDKANVPKEERIYKLEGGNNDKEYEDFYNRYHKYFFEPRENGGFRGDTGVSEGEVFNEAHLYSSRLWLGLSILTDIKEDGYCNLEAEL